MTKNAIPSILKKIVETKELEVAKVKANKSLDAIKQQATQLFKTHNAPRRGFAKALRKAHQNNTPGIIAEIKKASPSKGIISQKFNPAVIAKQYEHAGATCLSVLTDEQYFKGHADYLAEAKTACSLPILRKDFMIDIYQIYESYLMGADCILLIVACLDDVALYELHGQALKLEMDVLIEVHTEDELRRALNLPNSIHNIYGINNRDLNTFKTDLQTSIKLKNYIDKIAKTAEPQADFSNRLLVTESGIHTSDDINLMLSHNIKCFLIGEQFMKTDNPGQTLNKLLASL